MSPPLTSAAQRKAWHRQHKVEAALAATPLADAAMLGHVRLRGDGRYEVADREDSFRAFSCRSGCCLTRDHDGDHVPSDRPERWSGTGMLYTPGDS